MAVVASARVTSILEDEPANIWRDHQHEVGISETGFEDYFDGAGTAYGLRLQDVTGVDPIPLNELRALGVEPPQSWRYVDNQLVDQISAGPANLTGEP
jgi:predicted transcriptional regulator